MSVNNDTSLTTTASATQYCAPGPSPLDGTTTASNADGITQTTLKRSTSVTKHVVDVPRYVRSQSIGLGLARSNSTSAQQHPGSRIASTDATTPSRPFKLNRRTTLAHPRFEPPKEVQEFSDSAEPAPARPLLACRSESLPTLAASSEDAQTDGPDPIQVVRLRPRASLPSNGRERRSMLFDFGTQCEVSELPSDPKTWTPSQLSVYLAHVLKLTPRPVIADVMRFVVKRGLTGKRFLRLRDQDLVEMGINIAWCRILSTAREQLRKECLRSRIFGSSDPQDSSSPLPSPLDGVPALTPGQDIMSYFLSLPASEKGNLDDWKKNSWRRTEGKKSRGKVKGMAQMFEAPPEMLDGRFKVVEASVDDGTFRLLEEGKKSKDVRLSKGRFAKVEEGHIIVYRRKFEHSAYLIRAVQSTTRFATMDDLFAQVRENRDTDVTTLLPRDVMTSIEYKQRFEAHGGLLLCLTGPTPEQEAFVKTREGLSKEELEEVRRIRRNRQSSIGSVISTVSTESSETDASVIEETSRIAGETPDVPDNEDGAETNSTVSRLSDTEKGGAIDWGAIDPIKLADDEAMTTAFFATSEESAPAEGDDALKPITPAEPTTPSLFVTHADDPAPLPRPELLSRTKSADAYQSRILSHGPSAYSPINRRRSRDDGVSRPGLRRSNTADADITDELSAEHLAHWLNSQRPGGTAQKSSQMVPAEPYSPDLLFRNFTYEDDADMYRVRQQSMGTDDFALYHFAENDGNIITMKKNGGRSRAQSLENVGSIRFGTVQSSRTSGKQRAHLQSLFDAPEKGYVDEAMAEDKYLSLRSRDGSKVIVSRREIEDMKNRLAALEAELELSKSTMSSHDAHSRSSTSFSTNPTSHSSGYRPSKTEAMQAWALSALGEASVLGKDPRRRGHETPSWVGLGGWALAAGLGIGIVVGEAVLGKIRR